MRENKSMNRNDEMKKQLILLVIIVIILILIAVVSSLFEKNEVDNMQNEIVNVSNTIHGNSVRESEELSINGITEEQLKNMKGLLDEHIYEIYSEYFENNGEKSIEQIEVEMSKKASNEHNVINNNGVDYISEIEQEELEKELKEALEKYGYQEE